MLGHQLCHSSGQLPVALGPGRPRHRFQPEQRLAPRVGPRLRPPLVRGTLHHLATLLALRASQPVFALQGFEGDEHQVLPAGRALQRAQGGVRRRAAVGHTVHGEQCQAGFDVARGLDEGIGVRDQHFGRFQRFVGTIARQQVGRPLALVHHLHQQVRRQSERLLQQRLGLFHLAQVLIRGGQQVQIVLMVPVEIGADPLAGEVIALQLVGGFELRGRCHRFTRAA